MVEIGKESKRGLGWSRCFALVTMLVVISAYAASASAKSQHFVKVKVGSLGITAQGPTYIAIEKGYFKKAGIKVQLVQFNNGAAQIPSLSRGQIQVGVGTVTAGLFNAVASGVKLRLVADQGGTTDDGSSTNFVVRKDLAHKITNWSDLKGRKVALSCTGCAPEIILAKGLAKGGLTLHDVDEQVLSFPQMLPALQNGSIDVALTSEPFGTNAVAKGMAVPWKFGYQAYPNEEISTIVFASDFAAKTKIAQRYVTAYIHGLRDYVNAFQKGIGKDEVVKILIKYTRIKNPKMYDRMQPTAFRPDGTLNVVSLTNDLKWLTDRGLVKSQPDTHDLFATKFAERANKILGPYKK